MNATVKRMSVVLVCWVAALSCSSVAFAFFPEGFIDPDSGRLVLQRWRLTDFDRTDDGNVGANDGLLMHLEGGPSGFTPEELNTVRAAMRVWSDVPTSYASFVEGDVIREPILVTDDPRLFIAMQVTEVPEGTDTSIVPDPDAVQVPGLGFPVGAVTIIEFVEDQDATVEVGNISVPVSQGAILDADIVVDASSHRLSPEGEPAPFELKSTLVHHLGLFLGLAPTPLNNLRPEFLDPEDPESLDGLVETPVFWMTLPNGQSHYIGATPTMFPLYFEVEDDLGNMRGGWEDLAPDDISGISWLYPRGNQNKFFGINENARTKTRREIGLPSIPLSGAHIVAWADVSNSPSSQRVPLFSTMTGLYANFDAPSTVGQFDLIGLWRQFELPGTNDTLYTPSYTITMNPLDESGFQRQAPPGMLPEEVDSLHEGGEYNENYIAEVFHEARNINNLENWNAGTPLYWNVQRQTVVSMDTNRSLTGILRPDRPMFGDPNDVCPLNIIEEGAGGGGDVGDGDNDGGLFGGISSKSNHLRGFRDDVLLSTALGTSLVNLYYTVAPNLAGVMLGNTLANGAVTNLVYGMYWTMEYGMMTFGLMAAALILGWVLRGESRVRRWMLPVLLVGAAALLLSSLAVASIAFVKTEDMIPGADEVITGVVVSTHSFRDGGTGAIYTDVVVEVDEVLKGNATKATQLSFVMLGGKVNGVRLKVSEMPDFEEGEEVLLYLRDQAPFGLVLHGGHRGKLIIETDRKSGEKYITGESVHTRLPLQLDQLQIQRQKAAKAEMDEEGEPVEVVLDDEENAVVPLADYLEYMNALVEEKAAATEAVE